MLLNSFDHERMLKYNAVLLASWVQNKEAKEHYFEYKFVGGLQQLLERDELPRWNEQSRCAAD